MSTPSVRIKPRMTPARAEAGTGKPQDASAFATSDASQAFGGPQGPDARASSETQVAGGARASGGPQVAGSMRAASAPQDASVPRAPSTPPSPDAAARATSPLRAAFASCLGKHSHATAYGAIGLGAAALVLIVGFWPTVLLAACAAAGFLIGRYRDGDTTMHALISSFVNRFSKQTRGRTSL